MIIPTKIDLLTGPLFTGLQGKLLTENGYIAGLNIGGVPFGGLKATEWEMTEMWSLIQAWKN